MVKSILESLEEIIPLTAWVIHSRTHHEGSDQFTYKMESTGFFRTPLDRQLDERGEGGCLSARRPHRNLSFSVVLFLVIEVCLRKIFSS